MQTMVSTDRRRDARISVSLQALALDGSSASRRRAISLSTSAVVLEGADLPGSINQLELAVPGRAEPVWAAVEVLPVARRAGSVVRFTEMADHDRRALEGFLRRRLAGRPRERILSGAIEIERPGDRPA